MENLKQLNEFLGDLAALRRSSPEDINVIKKMTDDSEQGDEGLSYEVYKLPNGIYIKLKITTDSYGDNESVTGIEFVNPIEKKVTKYE